MFWMIIGIIFSSFTLFGTIELLLLTIGGLLPRRQSRTTRAPLQHIAVIIPAHNEENGITACIQSLLACELPQGHYSIYVIADNCSDNTAKLAQQAGAKVIVRHNPDERGKGYALDYAFQQLANTEIDAFLIIDADTIVEQNFITACETVFNNGAEALQCRYTVHNPNASLRTHLMHIALLAFNVLRPRGRDRWALSVGISGNGFGLTKSTLEKVPYSARSVVEDLEYHLKLVQAGIKVNFVDATTVRADMPTGKKGTDTQRTRWEGGRFRMIGEYVPYLLTAILKGQWRLIEPLLELLLLPLALHVFLLFITLALPFCPTQIYAIIGLTIVFIHVFSALWVGGGTWKDVMVLASVPFYILWKLLLMPRLLKAAGKNMEWKRTER